MKTQKKFTFGPKQTKALAALESGKYRQGFHYFASPRSSTSRRRLYCALGVMGLTLGFSGERLRNTIAAPIMNELAMKYECGIMSLNDSHKLSFKKIASLIRETPRKFFKRPV